ncbi:nucleotide sugar dehydrogenase [Funiculus sociatus GB2-A5]|uniref:Nucleotide sugar dehydrogenase n=1 Tax=Funiculus sociatus GB2-A5 TaxID=2933946 RepID=A0ABV0JQL3_9CYAN|nr:MULTISPECIES: nucleotide sugar dehydrogenase [unclassified Trichocoleus]MBD1906694.1 nucleotide sugar dehydrogenase [Trichocoleus sp. FACHB-832]MBD2063131.1 nucleotide sugar dehydrogenase [Trichocoleus sp. FACHB-6]
MNERIAVIGLGYVGLPVALAFAKKFPNTVGFDINLEKITDLKKGIDHTGEVSADDLKLSSLKITSEAIDLEKINFFVVAVPTPIDSDKKPNLTPLIKASETIGKVLQPGSVVVYESTVYPGVTEDICAPILAKVSGLQPGIDFKLGYSPERINPGDRTHSLEKILKVVAGQDAETLERVAKVYAAIIDAGVYLAASIKVAEAAKVIENTQRDLNIALMNELALICDRLGIRTKDVLDAAQTKWNFLPFTPGLVGGHCIGVDPYYLTTKAEQVGYHPQVILAGRRINDGMGQFLAQRLIKLLIAADVHIKGARLGILGLTFKENVSDLRNSRVPDIVTELRQFGIEPLVHDPLANPDEAQQEYGIYLAQWYDMSDLDGLVLAVNHCYYLEMSHQQLLSGLRPGGVLMDVKSIIHPDNLPPEIHYWSL